MNKSIIPWNSERFIIKQYLDTSAVYIYDRIENVGYINRSEMSRLCEVNESNITRMRKKPPKDLKAMLQSLSERCSDLSFEATTIQNVLQGSDFECSNHEQFHAALWYYSYFASGKENRLNAQKLLFQISKAGSLAFIMHMAGVKVQPIFDGDIEIETINAHTRIQARLHGVEHRKRYCQVMHNAYDANREQFAIKEGLNLERFFAKWTNFTYALLLGTNAQGLKKVPFADGNLIIGRNHIAGMALLKAILTVERYVADNFDATSYNNLKKLHIEASQIAVLQYRLHESTSYIENVETVRELPAVKNPELPEGND